MVVGGEVVTADEDEVVQKGRDACDRVFSRVSEAWPEFARLPRTVFQGR